MEPKAAEGGYRPYATLASALENFDRSEQARKALEEALRRKPDLSLTYLANTLPTKYLGSLESYLDSLRKAGLKD
jgi:hypothetical protein